MREGRVLSFRPQRPDWYCQQSYRYRHLSIRRFYPYSLYSLLLNCLYAIPSTAQPLLPQADSVVAGADSEHITAETPAHAPCSSIDVKYGRFPVIWIELAWNLYSSRSSTYASPRMSRCARSCLGMQRRCTTWRAQLATTQRREPSLCGRAESVCFASFLSLR